MGKTDHETNPNDFATPAGSPMRSRWWNGLDSGDDTIAPLIRQVSNDAPELVGYNPSWFTDAALVVERLAHEAAAKQ